MLLKVLQFEDGEFIIKNLFKVLFTLITLILPMHNLLSKIFSIIYWVNFSIRRNARFSWINTFLFNDTENIIFKCIFREKIVFAFLTEGEYRICRKRKYHLYWLYRKFHISICFFEKDHFHFLSEEWDHIFEKKKYHLSS